MEKKKVLEVEELKTNNKKTYDELLHANTIKEEKQKDIFSKTLIMKYIAVTIVLFAIIFGSILLFRQI